MTHGDSVANQVLGEFHNGLLQQFNQFIFDKIRDAHAQGAVNNTPTDTFQAYPSGETDTDYLVKIVLDDQECFVMIPKDLKAAKDEHVGLNLAFAAGHYR